MKALVRLRYVAALECAHVIPSRSLAEAAVCEGQSGAPSRQVVRPVLTTSFRHPEPCHAPPRATQCCTTRPTPLTAASGDPPYRAHHRMILHHTEPHCMAPLCTALPLPFGSTQFHMVYHRMLHSPPAHLLPLLTQHCRSVHH